MASVGQVKLPPLPPGKGPEDGMVQQSDPHAIARFALRDHFVHRGNLRSDVGNDFFRGQSLGTNPIGDFRPVGK
jgi:hypothetical protein